MPAHKRPHIPRPFGCLYFNQSGDRWITKDMEFILQSPDGTRKRRRADFFYSFGNFGAFSYRLRGQRFWAIPTERDEESGLAVVNHQLSHSETTQKGDPTMTVQEALQAIVDNRKEASLNYAVNYAAYGLRVKDPEELKVQCLYVLVNISRWRGPLAKEVRATLKAFAGARPPKERRSSHER